MSARALSFQSHSKDNLRAFDIRKDLLHVADLVELCFKDSLDADGRMYIRQMRRTAQSSKLLTMAIATSLSSEMPPGGFVWAEDGALVGNLSLIPVTAFGKRRYLIANVAVHPDHRRKGIARKLTIAALNKANNSGDEEIWLQVDSENEAAYALYQQMGFEEKAQRITWQTTASPEMAASKAKGVNIRLPKAEDWPQQVDWLKSNYPDHIRWNLPLNFKQFRPGFFGSVQRLLGDRQSRQWAATRGKQLLGILSWQSSTLKADRLWMAANQENEAEALNALLSHAHNTLRMGRALLLNYPAHRGEDQFRNFSFTPMRKLVWMLLQDK
jgi:ribosomal protein S18 acetylase RimI-like enzyme